MSDVKVFKLNRFEFVPWDNVEIVRHIGDVTYKAFDGTVFTSEVVLQDYIEKSLKDRTRMRALEKKVVLSNSEMFAIFPNYEHLHKTPKQIKEYETNKSYFYVASIVDEYGDGSQIAQSDDLDRLKDQLNNYFDARWNLKMILEEIKEEGDVSSETSDSVG
ncbi:hypothetical protein Phab24_id121 [Acinetobacter phage Phab24]|nr:hypothetical protein Phab24_id121 [Acinetobacter phage Phab24]